VQPVATCHQLPYLHKSYCHCDVILIMTSHAAPHSPRSHYDVILIVTSLATYLAMPTVMDVQTYVQTYVRMYGHLTVFNISR